MLFLDAALAFAVTMLVVATIVSKIVDFIYGTLCLRNQLFEEMLNKVALKVEANAMQCTDQVRTVVASLLAREQRTWRQWIWQYVSGQLPTSVSVDAFVKSVLGDAAQDDQVKKLEATLKAEGDKLTEFLRARSRWVSFVVALALALSLNIDSVNIADKYIQTPALSREIALKAGETLAKTQEELKAAQESLKAAEATKPASASEELKAAVAKLEEQVNQLNSSSFPIGLKYFPYYPYSKQPCPSWGVRARWILGIILTCLCAGLGTPFWYDLITNLSKLTSSQKKDDKAPGNG